MIFPLFFQVQVYTLSAECIQVVVGLTLFSKVSKFVTCPICHFAVVIAARKLFEPPCRSLK